MKENTTDDKGMPANDNCISRREALNKLGYAAFASSTMLLLLNNPTKAYAQSPGGNPEFPDPFPEDKSTNTKPASNDDWSDSDDPWK